MAAAMPYCCSAKQKTFLNGPFAMHEIISPIDIVIFGGTGDLSMRMLLPSLYHLDREGHLPDSLRIIAAARSDYDDEGFRNSANAALNEFVPEDYRERDAMRSFLTRLAYVRLDATDGEDYAALAARLRPDTENAVTVYYLSTAPRFYGRICANLAAAGIAGPNTRVALEKPIGHDLDTCRQVNDGVADVFDESRVFRVDHYLGKETVQNLIALRFANMLFEPSWNSVGIEQVQITVAETVGVEGRWDYYNESGALRDMLQNHMLQLLCLVAMEPPSSMHPDAVRDEKLKVLRSLRPISLKDIPQKTVAGQYTAGAIAGESVPGYAEEGGGGSDTETFLALRAEIDNWRWSGVPFYLRTGKRLPHRFSEIFIQFRGVPHVIFPDDGQLAMASNKLVIRLQPEENIKLMMMNKVPGLGEDSMKLQEVSLDLTKSDAARLQRRRIAYERLFLDILTGNTTLFVRRDETEAAWAWIDGIAGGWRELGLKPKPYAAGTWGPSAAIALTERYGHSWHD